MEFYTSLHSEGNLFLISGPCVVEDRDIMMKTAEFLKRETEKRGITYIFKSSFEKANRSSVKSYTGPGFEKGLKILEEVKKEFDLKILTDIHESSQAKSVAEVADVIQIPAFLARQTKLIRAAARTNKIINLKKSQFMAPKDMLLAAEKITCEDNYKILLTERGTFFGYHNLVVDFTSFPHLKSMNYPVVFDTTHSLQKPSIQATSGGNPEYVPMMARAAVATGFVDGLFLETHPFPQEALSDSASMIPLETIPKLLDDCKRIKENISK